MLRTGNIIGLVLGGLVGYLCSFDIDTSLGSAKIPFYVAVGATFGWLIGAVFHARKPDEEPVSGRGE
jgi:hypothetical protein